MKIGGELGKRTKSGKLANIFEKSGKVAKSRNQNEKCQQGSRQIKKKFHYYQRVEENVRLRKYRLVLICLHVLDTS